jgi:polyphosphate kinase
MTEIIAAYAAEQVADAGVRASTPLPPSLAASVTTTTQSILNRELALLAFNERVLEQARDASVPLLERLRFLCIVSSNLDEFFEIRVAGLKEQTLFSPNARGADGRTPREVFQLVSARAHALVQEQYALFNEQLLPALAQRGIAFLRRSQWSEAQRAWVREYFMREVFPVLTPIGLDPAHPFPRILNKSLNFAVELEGKDAFGRSSGIAVVQAPRALPRVIRLPGDIAGCEYGFVFLSSIVHAHVETLFAGMQVRGWYQFRVTRNSDVEVEDEEVTDLREALKGELRQRHYGDEVRLEVAETCSDNIARFLQQQFDLGEDDVYRVAGPVNLVRLMQVPDWVDRPELKYAPFIQGTPAQLSKQKDMFKVIRQGDVLLHHPFQSFKPVIDFIRQAAEDPDVLAIKQTVYRAGHDSELIEALIAAARRGKEVTVVVELLARFDEEANINWAARLEDAGAHVVYGIVGYKTHAKMAMVVRREGKLLRRYVHLGTGNYHTRTTKLYTDFGLFTCHEHLCADVNEVFLQLTGMGKAGELIHLWQSPFSLHSALIKAIEREAALARAGKQAAIIAKMNALTEPQVIAALYAAAQAGVRIELIVRGVCLLRPGLPGRSENITVRSVVGRLLEHSRIFCFRNEREFDVYLSSADWMERNLFRRIEVAFPVLDARLKQRVMREGLRPYLKDNAQAWEMDASGEYRRRKARRGSEFRAQENLLTTLAAR